MKYVRFNKAEIENPAKGWRRAGLISLPPFNETAG